MTSTIPARRRFSPLAVFEALATPHGVDRYLELVHPMLTVRELRASVTDVQRPTADSVRITLRPTRQWRGFHAGQYVQLTVEIDGVRRTRCFSPSSSAHRTDGQLELTVKAQPAGIVTNYLMEQTKPGMVFGLSQAEGEFQLAFPRPPQVLLISGGSGITPVLSMLRTLCDEGFTGDVAFLHYARSADDVTYRDVLDELVAAHPNVRVAYGYPSGDGGHVSGRFDPAHLEQIAPWYADAETYVCGPTGLMDSVSAHFDTAGLADQLHREAFQLTPLAAPTDDVTGTVRFARSGTEAANTGASLLEQAEAAGLTPEYGCRMGICFSCTQIKTSGCTRNILTGDLHTDPDTEIQLCISAPVGDVALDI